MLLKIFTDDGYCFSKSFKFMILRKILYLRDNSFLLKHLTVG